MTELKIIINEEKKGIEKLEGFDKLDPITITKIMINIAQKAMDSVKMKPVEMKEIVKPNIQQINKINKN